MHTKKKCKLNINYAFNLLRNNLGKLTYNLNLEGLNIENAETLRNRPLYDSEEKLSDFSLKIHDEIFIFSHRIKISNIISREVKNKIKKQIKSYARF